MAQPLKGANEVSFKLGKILSMSSDIKFNYEEYNDSETNGDGFALKMDYFYYFKNYTAVGMGLNANVCMRTLEENFAMLNYYILAKQVIPLNSYKEFNFYISAGAG
ncbi:MAG: hypothetical protein PHR82_03850 [Endomicrobiaceae bacterium]|nr:hypothetical protein [Endomicrobiaceae bacterium]